MERVIRLRKEVPEIGWGTYRIIETPRDILAIRYDWQGAAMLCVHNLGDRRMEVLIDGEARHDGDDGMMCLLTRQRSLPGKDGKHHSCLIPTIITGSVSSGLDRLASG